MAEFRSITVPAATSQVLCGPGICCKSLVDFFPIRNMPKECDSRSKKNSVLIGKHVSTLFIFARRFFLRHKWPHLITATICIIYSHGRSLFWGSEFSELEGELSKAHPMCPYFIQTYYKCFWGHSKRIEIPVEVARFVAFYGNWPVKRWWWALYGVFYQTIFSVIPISALKLLTSIGVRNLPGHHIWFTQIAQIILVFYQR